MANNLPNPLGTTASGDQFAIVDVVTATVPVRVINWPPHFLNPPPMSTTAKSPGPVGPMDLRTSNTPPIVPVRVINTNALDVRVMNFPGVPPPLPGLRPSAVPPALPTKPVKQFQSIFDRMPRQLESLFGRGSAAGRFAEKFTMNPGMGAGAGAGAVAGLAVGAAVAVLDQVKSIFIDPLVSAAKGGFQAGVSHGSGIEVLGKSAMTLGVSMGTVLLPAVLRVSAAMVGLSTQIEEIKGNFKQLGMVVAPLTTSALGEDGGKLFDIFFPFVSMAADRKKEDGILGSLSKFGSVLTLPGSMFRAFTGRHLFGDPEKANRAEKEGLGDVIQSLRQSMGPPSAYHGVADVRQAAQLAALEDPLERRMRDLMIKALERADADMFGKLHAIAENTKPAAG